MVALPVERLRRGLRRSRRRLREEARGIKEVYRFEGARFVEAKKRFWEKEEFGVERSWLGRGALSLSTTLLLESCDEYCEPNLG